MKLTRHLKVLLFAAALLAPVAARSQTAPQRAQAEAPVAARVESVPFESKLVGAKLPYHVVLPPGYADAANARVSYSVLYLLHGLGGGADNWVSRRARLAEYTAQYRMIIVSPEGRDGWYTDGVAPNEKFESYFVEELLPDVQKRFRTIEAREGRAVAGLSMGGYGALKFGLKYPDRFTFAASMSGALAVASWLPEMPVPAFVKPSVARVFGPAASPVRAANDIYRIARETPAGRVASLPYFYLDCGTEDGLLSNNRDFAALLVERKIPHEYRQLPGNHSWPYWDRQVREVLKIAAQRLAAPREVKAP
jgi:S-formylglutathione hydrolase FrmB